MSVNIHIRSTRLPESTDFYNLFDNVVAENNKSYFIYADGSKEQADIYEYNESGTFPGIQLDEVVGLILGDGIEEVSKSIMAQMPNLQNLKFGVAVPLSEDHLFADCRNLTYIDASPYLMEEIIAAENALQTSYGSLFVDRSRPISKTVVVKCNDGYLDVKCIQQTTVALDTTTEVKYTNGSKLRTHCDDGNFNLAALLSTEQITSTLRVCDVKLNSAISALNYIDGFGGALENTRISSISIPSSISSIQPCSFRNNSNLVSIDIPDSVSSVGRYAFDGCTSLVSAIFPDSLPLSGLYEKQILGKSRKFASFSNCKQLKYLKMKGVTIAQFVREGNPYSVVCPIVYGGYYSSYSMFGYGTRQLGCETVVELSDGMLLLMTTSHQGKHVDGKEYGGADPWYIYDYETDIETKFKRLNQTAGTHNSKEMIYGTLSAGSISVPRSNLGEVVIGYGVTDVDEGCFNYITSLNKVSHVGSTCKSYGDYAFTNCTSLTAVQNAQSVNSVGKHCFDGCSELTSFNAQLTSVGDYAFRGCVRLQGIEDIVSNNTTFGNNCFEGCGCIDLDWWIDTFFRCLCCNEIKVLLQNQTIFGALDNNSILLKYIGDNDITDDSIVIQGLDGKVIVSYNKTTRNQSLYVNGQWYWVTIQLGTCTVTIEPTEFIPYD